MTRPLIGVVAVVAMLHLPAVARAQCGSNSCAVGAAGTGGESSGGRAQGFRIEFPSTLYPGGSVSNTGNLDAGRLSISSASASVGTTAGTFRENPTPSVRGHGTGVFGDWSGQCAVADESEFPDC